MKKILLISCCALSALFAYPWGQKGHDTVAFIAENHLTPATKAAIDSIFDGKSIVYYANWLDNASHTPEYAYSKTWHYKNIDADETFRSARRNPNGDVIEAIYSQSEILADTTQSKDKRSLALKMIVHLVGDMHQPMHLGRASDSGGNRVNVKYFKNPINLHSAWDSRVLEVGHKWSYTEWQQQLDRLSEAEMTELLAGGNPEQWAEESYEWAKKIYDATPANTNIEYNYIAEWTPVIEERLLRAGLRIGDLLNYLLDPNYKAGYTPLPK